MTDHYDETGSAVERGWVLNVGPEPIEASLLADVALGVDVLPVTDAGVFGDTVLIAGEVYVVADRELDVDEDTLTITPALLAAAEEGDVVQAWDAALERVKSEVLAEVELDVEEDVDNDPIEVKVSQGLADRLQVAPGNERGPYVTLERATPTSEWRLVEINGEPLEVDLSTADPGSLPGLDLPSTPPATSPVPVTEPGPMGVIVRHEWTRGESVDLYVAYTDAALPDASTLHTEGVSALTLVTTDVTGQLLPPDEPVYFALWARNAVGAAPSPSAWVEGTPAQIPEEYMKLIVGELIATRLFGKVVEGVTLRGSILDITGAIYAVEGFLDIVAQNILAYAATFQDNVDLRGQNNSLRGKLTMTAGVTDPKQPPAIAEFWPDVNTDIAGDPDVPADEWYGLAQSTAASNESVSVFSTFGGGGIRAHDRTTGDRNPLYFANWPDFYPVGIVQVGATSYQVLGQDATNGMEWQVRSYLGSTLAEQFRWVPGIAPTHRPTIGRYSATEVVVSHALTTVVRSQRFTVTGTPQGAAIDLSHGLGARFDLGGIIRYESSPGTFRWLVCPETDDMLAFDNGGARNVTYDRLRANGNRLRGVYHDGTRLRHLDRNGQIWTYSLHAGADVAAAYTWVDGDGGGAGTAESGLGEPALASISRGAWIRVTTPPPPDGGDVDDADRVSIYLGDGLLGFFYRVEQLTPGDDVGYYDEVPASGTQAPDPSEFEGRTSAAISSLVTESGLNELHGDDDWQLQGPNLIDTGDLTVAGGAWTGTLRAQRIGQLIVVTGTVLRAGFTSTAYETIGVTLPVGMRPAAQAQFKAASAFNGAQTYQFRVSTGGVVSGRLSAGIATDLIVEGQFQVP